MARTYSFTGWERGTKPASWTMTFTTPYSGNIYAYDEGFTVRWADLQYYYTQDSGRTKNKAQFIARGKLATSASNILSDYDETDTFEGSLASGQTHYVTFPEVTIPTERIFNSSNPNTSTVYLYFYVAYMRAASWKTNTSTNYNVSDEIENEIFSGIDPIPIRLSAPPTVESSDPGGTYAPGSTYSINVNAAAKFGGNISNITLHVGNSTVSRTNSGSLAITLPSSGTLTPYITVSDSRGQTVTKYLSSIQIRNDYIYVSDVKATRIDDNGRADDSARHAMIQAKFTYANATPTGATVKVDDVTKTTVWYKNWSGSSGFSNQVTSWSEVTSGTILYGNITGQSVFDPDTSYMISVQPSATSSAGSITGSSISAYLAQKFYLIVGHAGGHALGIGQKPVVPDDTTALMQVAMPLEIFGSLKVNNNAGVLTSLIDLFYPIGSYYETSNDDFNPNTVWGGQWVEDTVGKVTVGYGTNYTSDGGSASQTVPIPYHRHTGNSLSVEVSGSTNYEGSHTHNMKKRDDVLSGSGSYDQILGYNTTVTSVTAPTDSAGSHSHTVSASGNATGATSYAGTSGATMSVMQPYKVVHRWHRTG